MTRLASILASLLLSSCLHSVSARDDGRYAQSPNKQWFGGLTNAGGSLCCDGADGVRLEDPDWEFNGESYRVKLEGDWIDVDPNQVVTVPNIVGYAIVWPFRVDGKMKIRCFLPGSGA